MNEDAHLAARAVYHEQEFAGTAVAVLHRDDIGYLCQLLDDWNRKSNVMQRWIVIDHDRKFRKELGDRLIESYDVCGR